MTQGSKLCLDVDYRDDRVVTACVGFSDWSDSEPAFETTRESEGAPAPYESGQFYRREMPYLLELLAALDVSPTLLILDGFVWLDGERPGLGARLSEALRGACPVIGVAKRPFVGASRAVPVMRGSSQVPLFVSAIGIALDEAARCIAGMHGEHRVPTLLKRVDQLSPGR